MLNSQNFIQNYYSSSNHRYATRRNGLDLVPPKVKTEVAKNSCFYLGIK